MSTIEPDAFSGERNPIYDRDRETLREGATTHLSCESEAG